MLLQSELTKEISEKEKWFGVRSTIQFPFKSDWSNYAFDKMFSGSGDIFIVKVPSIPAHYTTIFPSSRCFPPFSPPAQLFPHIVFNLLLKNPIFIAFGPLVSPFIWLFRKSKLSQGGPLAVAWHLSPRLHLTRLWLQLWKLKPTSSSSSSSSYSTSSSSPSSSVIVIAFPPSAEFSAWDSPSYRVHHRLLTSCNCWILDILFPFWRHARISKRFMPI